MGNDFVDHVLDLLDKKKLMNIRSSAVYMEWDKNKDKIVLPSEQFNELQSQRYCILSGYVMLDC